MILSAFESWSNAALRLQRALCGTSADIAVGGLSQELGWSSEQSWQPLAARAELSPSLGEGVGAVPLWQRQVPNVPADACAHSRFVTVLVCCLTWQVPDGGSVLE